MGSTLRRKGKGTYSGSSFRLKNYCKVIEIEFCVITAQQSLSIWFALSYITDLQFTSVLRINISLFQLRLLKNIMKMGSMKLRTEIVLVLCWGWRNAHQASSYECSHPLFERVGPASKAKLLPWVSLQLLKQLSDYLKLSDSTKVREKQLATGVYTNRKK